MLQVYWFKDGKQISKRSEHYRISRDPDGTCSLHTAAASLDDDGNYTILAGNPEVSWKNDANTYVRLPVWYVTTRKIMFSGLNGKRGLNETGKPWRGSKVYVEQALELSFPALTLTFHFLLSVWLAVPGVLSPHKFPLFLSQGRVSCTGRMMVQAVNQRGRSQRSAPGHMRRWGWQQRERRQTKSPSGACGAGCSPSARASVLAHTFPHGFKTVQEASI